MRKTLFYLAILLATTSFAQQGINYKAIITDDGSVLADAFVDVQFTILQDGTTLVYDEIHSTTTDVNGIIILNIGEGEVELGDWETIDWREEQFLKVAVDSGSGYIDMGTTAFKAVPHAKAADKLLPTDRVVIGDDSMSHDERLYIEAPTVPNGELVDFVVDSSSSGNDIINLKYGTAPTSGTAQFIEASVGSDVKFKVNHTGSIYSAGGIDLLGDINLFGGDLNASYNANISGDLELTGNLAVGGEVTTDLDMGENEIHSAHSGDADMKAYAYGSFYVTKIDNDAYVSFASGSEEFTVTWEETGIYKIESADPNFSSEDNIQVSLTQSRFDDTPSIVFSRPTNSYIQPRIFYIHQYDLNGNLYDGDPDGGYDAKIHFVVYKK